MSVTLSLRVTSDKRKPGVKVPNSKEEDLFPLIKHLRTTTQNSSYCHAFLDELQEARDLKTQLEIMRRVLKPINSVDESENPHPFLCLQYVVEILLSLELKSPLRCGIVRILKEFKNSKSRIVSKSISEVLKGRFSSFKYEATSVRQLANAMSVCFDNFDLGLDAIRQCYKEALLFLNDNLAFFESVISAGDTKEQNSELCQCIHSLVRTTLHVISLEVTENFDKLKLHNLAKKLMACDHLPLDTRTNCGLLSVATGRDLWHQMLLNQMKSPTTDDLTSLCLYFGIIETFPKEELTSIEHPEFNGNAPVRIIFEQIMNIHKRNPLQPTLTLSVARTLVALSRVMVGCSGDQLLPMLPALLSYTWEHLEHVMDSVKHLAVTLLHNIVRLHSSEVDVYSSVLSAMQSLPPWGRARHTALSALLGKVPVSQLVSGDDEIQLMFQHLSQEVISSHATNAFQELLRHHYEEISDKDKWKELWIRPLLRHLHQNPSSVPLQQILSKVLIISPDIIQYVLTLSAGQVSLGTTLLCLRLSHKAGLLDTTGPDTEMWRGVVSYDTLRSAVSHPDDETRLSCLSLVVEAPKTCEVFTPLELQLVVDYVALNLHWDSPASRQRNSALLGKFVSRFNDSRQALQRRAATAATQESSQYSQWQQLLAQYSQCQRQLEQCCVDNLFPGATHSRRVSALHLLLALRPSGSPRLRAALLPCLADSYEDVKAMAVKLLTTTPGLLDDFKIPSKVLHVIDKALEHAGGVKPLDCLSAAYLLATLSHTAFSDETLSAVTEKYPFCDVRSQDGIEHLSVYSLVQIVMDRLNQQLEVAEVHLLKASASGPLHGLLFTIRLLLTQINLKECKSDAWKQLIKRLVYLSFNCSAAVALVVNNDSPEGHFPMDFDFDPSAVCGEQEGVEGVTSQMVLLCSWRTVKEVSLLLGHLAEECSIASSQQDGLLNEEDVLKIGHHLTTLLAETKHRGAFEQAYVGFCKLVTRLWRLPAGNLQQLPLKWLNNTLEEISNNDQSLCATRRSAGIPFMIQALIHTQLEVQGPSSVEPWVRRLLELAADAAAPPSTHTHALNILRALFRSTRLGEAVAVCVERAFVVTIAAFSASNWMERNSATLLLSALVTRVFGVPRSKSQDSLSWKNKMTGRIFFQRYPKLFGFFQQELMKASQSGSNLHPSLYPVLLILGRLYPSSLEGTDSNVQLTQYVPDIAVCSGSNIYKTRTLAARAMVALMTLPHLDDVIEQITQPIVSANLRHGLLLQVAFYLKQSNLKIGHPFFKDKAESWILKLVSLFDKKLSCPELEALFHIFDIFCEKYFMVIRKTVWTKIKEHSQVCLKKTEVNVALGAFLLRPRICEFLLKLAILSDIYELEVLCCDMLRDSMYEVRNIVLVFLDTFGFEKDYSDNFSEIHKTVDSKIKESCKSFLLDDHKIVQEMVQIALRMFQNKKEHPEDKANILSVLGNWESVWTKILSGGKHMEKEQLNNLLHLCRDTHDAVAINAMYCLIKLMEIKKKLNLIWDGEDLSRISEMVGDITASETSYLFDEPLRKLLIDHFSILQLSTQNFMKLQIYKALVELSDASKWSEVIDQVIGSESNIHLTSTLLLSLALEQFTSSGSDESDFVGKVFDKEEVNTDYEEYILSRVCSRKLRNLLASHEHLLNAELEPPLRDWITKETGLEGSSLAAVIALGKMKVLELDSRDPCQFLNPGYQRLRLNSLKLNNL